MTPRNKEKVMHGFEIIGQTGLMDDDGTLLKLDVVSCYGEWFDEGVIRLQIGDVYHDFTVRDCTHLASMAPRSYLVAVDFSMTRFEDQLIAFSPFSVALPTSQWNMLY
jgi:hypothetical protein